MFTLGKSILKQYGPVFGALLVFLAPLGISLNTLFDEQQTLFAKAKENIYWSIAQLELELHRFTTELHHYSVANSDISHDDLLEHFDIIWSRFMLYQEGSTSERLREFEQAQEFLDSGFKLLQTEDAAMQALQKQNRAEIDRIHHRFTELLNPLHQITLDVMQAEMERYGSIRSRLQGSYWEVTLVIGGVLLGGIILILLLLRESRRNIDLARNLEHLNAKLEDKVLERTAQLSAKNVELEATHEELKTTQSQLLQSEKLASVGQLAAGVAHEINNPVGYIMSNLGTLQRYVATYQRILQHYESLSATLGEDARVKVKQQLEQIAQVQADEDLEFIQDDIADLLSDSIQGTQQVKDIVQGLKSFSRVDAPELQLVDLNDCINSTLKMVNNELKYTCKVHTDLQALPEIRCNPGQINQVLMNLLVNASQAIDKSGAITVSSAVEGDEIVMRVADTGVGIAATDLANIFTPFFTTKPVGEGTGLGLSVSYGIIQEHGGSIEVDSEVGVGTTFSLHFPLPNEVTKGEREPICMTVAA